MAISNTQITQANSNTVIYTSAVATGNLGNAITTMIFCNTTEFDAAQPTTNQALVTVYAVPNTKSASTETMIINKLPIPAGETVSLDQEKMVLEAGDKIVVTSTTANISVTISTLAV